MTDHTLGLWGKNSIDSVRRLKVAESNSKPHFFLKEGKRVIRSHNLKRPGFKNPIACDLTLLLETSLSVSLGSVLVLFSGSLSPCGDKDGYQQLQILPVWQPLPKDSLS